MSDGGRAGAIAFDKSEMKAAEIRAGLTMDSAVVGPTSSTTANRAKTQNAITPE